MNTRKTVSLDVLKDLIDDAKESIRSIEARADAGAISKNTKHTQSYNFRKEVKRLYVIHALVSKTSDAVLEELAKDKLFNEYFGSILNPEDGGSRIEVKEGQTLLQVLAIYKDSKDVYARALKAANKAGLKLANDSITFVKA